MIEIQNPQDTILNRDQNRGYWRSFRKRARTSTGRAAYRWIVLPLMSLIFLSAGGCAYASSTVPGQTGGVSGPAVLDRVVANVDGQAILFSDVEDEVRFLSLQPQFEPPSDRTPEQALSRVIDRVLIDQQRALQPGVGAISQKEVDDAVATMRKQIPVTAQFNCETDAGWTAYLAAHGFTPEEVKGRLRERLGILKFIDVRFGGAIQVSFSNVKEYYDSVLVPEVKKTHSEPPPLRKVAGQIREILRQQQVTKMLDVWLKNLREEGQIQILDPTFANSSGNTEGRP